MKDTKQRSAGLQRKNSDAIKTFQFKPGKSGNPLGRPKGSVSPTAALRRSLTRRDADQIARKLIAKAKSGDPACLKILFDRLDYPLSGPMAMALSQTTSPVLGGGHEVHLHLIDNHREPIPTPTGATAQIILPKGRMELDEAQAAARRQQQHAGGGLPIGDLYSTDSEKSKTFSGL